MSNDMKISIEEVLELVTFTRDSEGRLRISDVKGDVLGYVVGNVYCDVHGNVYGSVIGDVGGTVYGSIGGKANE